MYGKKVEGVIRCTFAFDEKGKVTHVWPSVKVDGHSQKVLEALTGEPEAARAPNARSKKAPGSPRARKGPGAAKKKVVAKKTR
jgi:hypothetical protein